MNETALERFRTAPPPTRTRRQWVALGAPPALIATTYPMFRLAKLQFGEAVGGQLAWFVGMSLYWLVWGAVFSLWILGPKRVRELMKRQPATPKLIGLVAFMVAMAAAVRFLVPAMGYPDATPGARALLAVSTFGNGVFEELFWRGVFFDASPQNRWLRVIWPSMWFGLWHLVPGSISVGGAHVAMVIGPMIMGLYLAYLTKRTGTIWWAILAHTIGGLVMIA